MRRFLRGLVMGLNLTLPGITNQKSYRDRGRSFDVEDIAGVMREPSVKRGTYSVPPAGGF